jgi:hypothetical protein
LIALEPEAASIYCQYLPTEKLNIGGHGMVVSMGNIKRGLAIYTLLDALPMEYIYI